MSLLSYAKDIREKLMPIRVTSAFLEKGVLTPEEFVAAGDQLVFKCPTWSWESGSASLLKPYLPKEKQYLVTRGVPCLRRISALQSCLEEREVEAIEGDEGESFSGWMETKLLPPENLNASVEIELGEESKSAPSKDELAQYDTITSGLCAIELHDGHFTSKSAVAEWQNGRIETAKSDSSYPDLNSFVEDNIAESDSATLPAYFTAEEPVDAILRTRSYDISITYDKYYQVPRLWLIGYDEAGSPLCSNDIFEDIMQDYARQTVTIELHPHIGDGTQAASVHPCRHASVMQNIVANLLDSGISAPRVDQYLFFFLKFIQSVVPTIDYDFTMEVDAGS